MITQEQFNAIKDEHGAYASWAVWAPAGPTPTSNIGDMSVLDPAQNPGVLALLNPSVVMLGLNISRPLEEPLCNFHDKSPRAKDYKIRYAFMGTRYYGAYMTDVVKFVEEVDSSRLMTKVRQDPGIISDSGETLRREFRDIGVVKPELIAFGGHTERLARTVLTPDDYSRIVKVTHYSHFIGKEDYRRQVLAQCL